MNRLMNRRTLLRGAGVAIALPWMESLAPKVARGQTVAYPKRFIPIFFPNGTATFWRPANPGVGDAWKLSPILEPFTALKSKVTVLTNMENYTPAQADNPDVEPSHGRQPGVHEILVLEELPGGSGDRNRLFRLQPAYHRRLKARRLLVREHRAAESGAAEPLPQQTKPG